MQALVHGSMIDALVKQLFNIALLECACNSMHTYFRLPIFYARLWSVKGPTPRRKENPPTQMQVRQQP